MFAYQSALVACCCLLSALALGCQTVPEAAPLPDPNLSSLLRDGARMRSGDKADGGSGLTDVGRDIERNLGLE